MASVKIAKGNRHADPMKTRTGKPKLGPLSIKQLNELLSGTKKPKNAAKIRNRIKIMESRIK